MHHQRAIFTLVFLLFFLPSIAQVKKILIVSTNRDSVGGFKSGTFLREIAYPFNYFVSQGFDVDIVTPLGGEASIYAREPEDERVLKIQASDAFAEAVAHTLDPNQVIAKDYMAVFYPGGHGQFFDVVDDERIAGITAAIYENNGVIGTAGHGAASLINVRLNNGRWLVEGKTMTCFPSWAEKKFMNISHYGKLLAFDMQTVLSRRGARLTVSTPETFKVTEINQIIDAPNRLVTGAFAGSAQWVAEEMVKLLPAPEK